tara:strand:+ start:26 stop:481 length:456 start_codon:yes stop_codon:yes gene_type:complete
MNKNLLEKINNLNIKPLSKSSITFLEQKLHIDFSPDFIKVCSHANFQYFKTFEFLNSENESNYSITGYTIRLRKTSKLPLNTLCLSEDDASILLMKCLGTHEEIYWIAIEDYNNYCEEKPLLYSPIIFESFHDFFEYLLKSEEEIDALEAK